MKFSVRSNILVNALSKVIGVTPIRSTLPILGNVLFVLEGNKLILTGTDLEVYVKIETDVDGKEDGRVAVPSKKLETLINNMENKELTFEVSSNHKMVIKTKGGRWTITGEDAEDFPTPIELENTSLLRISKNTLIRYMAKAIHAASPDELRRNMNGIYFDVNEGELKVVSTDGHRLVRIIKNNFDFEGEKISMLVPIKSCQYLIKLLKSISSRTIKHEEDEPEPETGDTADDSMIDFIFNENFLRCEFDSISVTTRLIDDSFPNYESVIPTENDKTLKVNKNDLIGAVKRSIIMSDQNTNRTSFTITQNEMKVKAANNEYGTDSDETIDSTFTESEEFEIAFNGKYLLEAIQQFDTNDILFDFSTPLKAAIIRPSEQLADEDIMLLVMPVRNMY